MPCEEDAVLDISMDLDEDLLRTDPNLQSEDVGYCVEIGASQDVNVPLSNTQRQNNSFETDHDYCCKVDNITKMMDQLILKGKENVKLKNKLKTKQKEASKLKKKVRSLKEEVKTLKKQLVTCSSQLVDPVLLELEKNRRRKLRGSRFSDKIKNMAIILHYCSGKAYRQIRKYFSLPSVGTIKRWLSRLEVKEGFSKVIFKLLKVKAATLPLDERVVTIFLDEMSISQRLTYVANAKTDYFTGFPTKVGIFSAAYIF